MYLVYGLYTFVPGFKHTRRPRYALLIMIRYGFNDLNKETLMVIFTLTLKGYLKGKIYGGFLGKYFISNGDSKTG